MIIAATGHRPDKLGGYSESVHKRLRGLAREYLGNLGPAQGISGMALGWDQAFAAALVDLGIPFIAAVPFEGQECRWPAESQTRYLWLLRQAGSVHIVSDYPGTRAMQLRNEWMVDRAQRMCALWDGSWGGTFNAVTYAKRRRRPVDNLWRRWSNDLSDLLA